jgi:hypothetical protein
MENPDMRLVVIPTRSALLGGVAALGLFAATPALASECLLDTNADGTATPTTDTTGVRAGSQCQQQQRDGCRATGQCDGRFCDGVGRLVGGNGCQFDGPWL